MKDGGRVDLCKVAVLSFMMMVMAFGPSVLFAAEEAGQRLV